MSTKHRIKSCIKCNCHFNDLEQKAYCQNCFICYRCEDLLYAHCNICKLDDIEDYMGNKHKNDDYWGYKVLDHFNCKDVEMKCDCCIPSTGSGLGMF